MKKVVSISLGSADRDYEFTASFFGEEFHVRRIGAGGDAEQAARLVREHDGQVDAIGLGGMAVEFRVGKRCYRHKPTLKVARLARYTPVVGGRGLKAVVDCWALRDIARRERGLFYRRNVLFLSGIANWDMVSVMQEFTTNLTFGDPVLHFGMPTPLHGMASLERYARVSMPLLTRRPYVSFFPRGAAGESIQTKMLESAFQRADVVVGDLGLLLHYCPRDMTGKVIITDTLDTRSLADFRTRGARLVCSTMPALAGDRNIGLGVVQAMMVAHLDKPPKSIVEDDYMELVRQLNLRPRIVHVQGQEKQVAKVAYVWIPNNLDSLFEHTGVSALSLLPTGAQQLLERAASVLPLGGWSRLTGIASSAGPEAEVWIYFLPWTPALIDQLDVRDVARRIEDIAAEAQTLGASILGLSARSASLAEAGARAAANATLPITSGFSSTASTILWAAREACLRMGFEADANGRFNRRAMLVGVRGGWSEAAAMLLAFTFRRLTLVDKDPGQLLDLAKRVEDAVPGTSVAVAGDISNELPSADLVMTGLSGPARHLIDLALLRPGSVLVDTRRPKEFTSDDQNMRPDVLIIRAGVLELPGPARYERDFGMPLKVAPASMCEAIVLALEGRPECFTRGPTPTVDSVKEIYKLLLKHGFHLGAIRGVESLLRDPEIALARERGEEQMRVTTQDLPALEDKVDMPNLEVRMDK